MADGGPITDLVEALTARSVDLAGVDAFAGAPESVRRRLSIYRGNVQANARKALFATYPVTAKIVGDEFFGGLADAFAAVTPSQSGDLNEYGDRFPAFVAAFPHAAGLPYLPDVATLEWSVHRAHYAADVPALDPARLADVPTARLPALCFALSPGTALIESPWPLARIFAVHQHDHVGAIEVDLASGPERALVYRPRFRVEVRSLSPGACAFIAACRDQSPIAAAVERAQLAERDWQFDRELRALIADRVLVDFALPPHVG